MPEGDTVWLTARTLHKALAGRPLTRTDFRVPQLATADLTGETVSEVVSRGKHLMMRTDAGRSVHTHLRMDGSWRRFRLGQRWTGGPDSAIRLILANADWVAVGYRVHDIALVPRDAEQSLVGHLGPDLLGPDWDSAEAVRRLAAQPNREIAPALLDQRNLAGIGNLYKSEVLFLRGVTPWTPVADVELPLLVDLARRLLDANKTRWEQVTTGDTAKGRRLYVFERSGRPCLRCSTLIAMAEQGEPDQPVYTRLTYWCPSCQKGPAPAVDIGRGRSST